MADDVRVGKGLLAGTGIGALFGLGGYMLALTPSTTGMGVVMFCLVPFAAGFAIALVTRKGKIMATSALLAALASLVVLVAAGKEGVLCAILAFPPLAISIMLGGWLGLLFDTHVLKREDQGPGTTVGVFVALPLLILLSHWIESPSLNRPRVETVTSSISIQAAPEQVWQNIQSIDSVHGSKPWLMYVGLPVPIRCTIERGGVGAKRICYFDNGTIEETVSEWSPPRLMRLRIDRTHMKGRHWMDFDTAQYELVPSGSGTVLKRTTVISSTLYPVFYWRPMERFGVEAEHEYILNDAKTRSEHVTPR